MPHTGQLNGMRGVYLVAAELSRLGLIAFPTSRSARGADILATTANCAKTFSVEVKTTTTNSFWQLAEHVDSITAKTHVYVFVRIHSSKKTGETKITYYPVQNKFVIQNKRLPDPAKPKEEQYRKGYSIELAKVERFANNWSVFRVATPRGKTDRASRSRVALVT